MNLGAMRMREMKVRTKSSAPRKWYLNLRNFSGISIGLVFVTGGMSKVGFFCAEILSDKKSQGKRSHSFFTLIITILSLYYYSFGSRVHCTIDCVVKIIIITLDTLILLFYTLHFFIYFTTIYLQLFWSAKYLGKISTCTLFWIK